MIFILCLLAIFSLIAAIFGRQSAQRGLSLTLGIAGASAYYYIQAILGIGLIALAFILPPIGVPLLLIALGVRYVLPFGRALRKSKRESAVLDTEHEARQKRFYLAERKVDQLRQALAQAVDADTVSLCKELSQDEGWHLALPILNDALSRPKVETRLCAVHGLRHVYDPQVVQRIVAGDANFDASSRQHWHNVNFKPELVGEVADKLGKCAVNPREDKRVRVAALIAIGNASYVEAHRSLLALLGDKDEDVRAAACRAARQLMPPTPPVPSTEWRVDAPPTPYDWGCQVAATLYQSHFDTLLNALSIHNERLQVEAMAASCAMARLAAMSASDLDGLVRVMQNLSTAPSVGVRVHDAADEAVAALKSVQRGRADAHGGSHARG